LFEVDSDRQKMKILMLVIIFSDNLEYRSNSNYLQSVGCHQLSFSEEKEKVEIKSPPFVLYNPKNLDKLEIVKSKESNFPKKIEPKDFLPFFSNCNGSMTDKK